MRQTMVGNDILGVISDACHFNLRVLNSAFVSPYVSFVAVAGPSP